MRARARVCVCTLVGSQTRLFITFCFFKCAGAGVIFIWLGFRTQDHTHLAWDSGLSFSPLDYIFDKKATELRNYALKFLTLEFKSLFLLFSGDCGSDTSPSFLFSLWFLLQKIFMQFFVCFRWNCTILFSETLLVPCERHYSWSKGETKGDSDFNIE